MYTTLEEIQVDLDDFLKDYNGTRTNQGKYCNGRTLIETFVAELDFYKQYVYDGKEVMKETA